MAGHKNLLMSYSMPIEGSELAVILDLNIINQSENKLGGSRRFFSLSSVCSFLKRLFLQKFSLV